MTFLGLFALMLLHIAIVTTGTVFSWWHTESTPVSIALTTLLYYVLPLVFSLFIYLFISQLLSPTEEEEDELPSDKTSYTKKSSSSKAQAKKKASSSNQTQLTKKSSSSKTSNQKPDLDQLKQQHKKTLLKRKKGE